MTPTPVRPSPATPPQRRHAPHLRATSRALVGLVAALLVGGCGGLGVPNADADAPLPLRVCASAAPSFGDGDAVTCATLEARYRLSADAPTPRP